MESYRAVLEVAKYCGPQDVLRHCREVSSVWAQAGLSNELWDLYSDTCPVTPLNQPLLSMCGVKLRASLQISTRYFPM